MSFLKRFLSSEIIGVYNTMFSIDSHNNNYPLYIVMTLLLYNVDTV